MKTTVLRLLTLAILLGLPQAASSQENGEYARFHHVHLNVKSAEESIKFYTKFFGGLEIKFHDKSPAIFTERSFILFTEVTEPPRTGPVTALSHIGWATTDGPATFEWLKKQGAEFQTEIGRLGADYGMYIFGPDRELVEVWTGSKNHRFDHVHLWATDAEVMFKWFEEHLGFAGRLMPKRNFQHPENIMAIRMSFMMVDNVNMVIFERPEFESVWFPGSNYKTEDAPEKFEPTKGYVIDHLAFSYPDIDPVFKRMKESGVEIVEEIATRPEGHTSFFVLAPDDILIEIVKARPIPDSSWE